MRARIFPLICTTVSPKPSSDAVWISAASMPPTPASWRASRTSSCSAVRSSSVAEDTAESSAAGQFATLLDVDVDHLDAAVDEVRRSGAAVADATGQAVEDVPVAVLVQPMVEPRLAGVAFGVDPVTGRSDRRVVTAVRGSPEPLVSGTVEGSRWELDEHGTVVTAERSFPADVAVRGGSIEAVEPDLSGAAAAADTVVDASGLLVLPGVVDVHTHVRVASDDEPDRFYQDSVAAAFGGTTTFLAFNNPGTGSSPAAHRSLLTGIDEFRRACFDAAPRPGSEADPLFERPRSL